MQTDTRQLARRSRRLLLLLLPVLALLPARAAAHGAIHEQLQALTVALENQPGDPALFFRQAELLVAHDEPEAALRSIIEVEARAPELYPTAVLRARIALASGQPEQVGALLAERLAAQPDDWTARLVRARAHAALGRRDEACADYRLIWRHNAAAACDLVQEVADALAPAAPAEAIAVLDTGLQRHGPVPSLLLRALALDLTSARYDSALQRVQALRGLSPRPEPWMVRRAEILAQAGRTAEARAAWQALAAHLDALPNLERGSPTMSEYAARARAALAAPPPFSASPPHP